MNEATVSALVTDLNLSLEDPSRIAQQFDETVEKFARSGMWVEASVMDTLVAGTGLYALPTNALTMLCAFYDDRHLQEEQPSTLDMLGTWRDHKGAPVGYVLNFLADRTFLLYPTPTVPSKPVGATFGEPLGRDYPSAGCVVLTTFRRTSFQPWLALVMALEISAMEFRREGKQRDTQYADMCAGIAGLMEQYLS